MSLHTLLDAGFDVIGQNLKEASQALCGAIVEDPKQTLGAADLGDEREGGVAAAPLDLIHADRLDPGEITMGEAPQNGMFHGSKHVVSGGVEDDSSLLPRQPLRPSSEKPAVGRRQNSLPSAHGTRSTVTPHFGQSTRRKAETKNTAMVQSGTNSNLLAASRS